MVRRDDRGGRLAHGTKSLVLLAFPPLALELFHGNVHLFMAVAIVVGFRFPAAWAFVTLTKVSPGVGALLVCIPWRVAEVRRRGRRDPRDRSL